LFRDDDGIFKNLQDPLGAIPYICPGAAQIPAAPAPIRVIPSDPTKWERVDWMELMLGFHVLTVVEMELFRIREELAAPSKAPRSFAELMRSGDAASSIRTATGLFNTLREIAAAFQNNAVHNDAMNETTVKILDDEGARVITERFAEFAKAHASDRPQLVVCVNGVQTTKEWVWHYLNSLAAAWQKHCLILPAQTPTRPLIDILVTPITWPSDPTVMMDMQALRVQAGLLSIAANVTRERTIMHQASFWSTNLQRIIENYYVKVVHGKANLAEWSALPLSLRGITAKRTRSDSTEDSSGKDIEIKEKQVPAWKKKRIELAGKKKSAALEKRDKDKTKVGADKDKQVKQYDKCDKCGKPTPEGKLTAFPTCFPCRKRA
jgi:RNA polymerase-binding transcription factor DksA